MLSLPTDLSGLPSLLGLASPALIFVRGLDGYSITGASYQSSNIAFNF